MQKPNDPIWFNKDKTVVENNDTYQTIKTNTVTEINIGEQSPYKIMVCTPCHSEVSMHYTQAVLKFQLECMKKNIMVSFSLLKSSLVTQGRNLCVAEFLNHKDNYDYLLFIDSDISFKSETIFKMIEADKDIIACPYPMKMFETDKMWKKIKETDMVKSEKDLLSSGYMYPIKIGKNELIVDKGVMEVTHAPTGCMLIKRNVIEKLIAKHPELQIYQPTVINGKEVAKENFYNLFDTLHDPETKRYFGEDFGFCQRWTDIGGKVYVYVMDHISHIGDHEYCGRFYDMLTGLKRVDVDKKIK